MCCTNFKEYLSDPLNYLDNGASNAALFYIVAQLIEVVFRFTELLYLICAWIRGLAYFKTFGLTKYICKMIAQVCIDMQTFFSVLCYLGFAFMFIFQAASFEFKTADLTLMQTFEMSFMIILGIFNFDGWIFEIQLIMIASILLNQIRMLNLFLAFF